MPIIRSIAALALLLCIAGFASAQTLPGSKALDGEKTDFAQVIVAGADRFLLREIERSVTRRARYWKRDFSSATAYDKSIAPNRKRLSHILGIRDNRVKVDSLELMGSTVQPALVGKGRNYEIFAVRWPVFRDVHGEGLLIIPTRKKPAADVIALPDAALLPEHIIGLASGVAPESQYARHLAEAGCRVLIPMLIDRTEESRRGRAKLTTREFLYRPSFELGRHLIGYEVQKILAGIDWFKRQTVDKETPVGVIGWGEGGLLALYAAALDKRIDATCVSGHFQSRNEIWKEPIDRNVFGLLEQFGDAELASMIAPRSLLIEACKGPEITVGGGGGAPGRLVSPTLEAVKAEHARAQQLVAKFKPAPKLELIVTGNGGQGPFGTVNTVRAFAELLSEEMRVPKSKNVPMNRRPKFNANLRRRRQIHEIDRDTQWLLRESSYVRKNFMSRLKFDTVEDYAASVKPYRAHFANEVIGRFEYPLSDPQPRTRLVEKNDKWLRYEVVLDVFPDVIAYGLLTMPRDAENDKGRPVVVCQHGLEGRPQSVIGERDAHYYKAFATKLAERGFITFAPQNLYIGRDMFRTLQRKANPLKKSLFSIITPQHQQILNYLKSLPQVDSKRIAFYGLSYGGKTAMRVPAMLEDYCLSICSADFNEWVWKNASTRSNYSYVYTGEYEIFEFDLGSTFNYAEMAALIAPRPFMVERGHFDGVAPDATVGYEFAKVRRLYNAQLKLPADKCQIEWFVGPHTINGKQTYAFLHKHLDWPEPKQPEEGEELDKQPQAKRKDP